MRRIQVRPTGKTWEEAQEFACEGTSITHSGDLVILLAEPVTGQPNSFSLRPEHAYAVNTWAEMRDAGKIEVTPAGETRQ